MDNRFPAARRLKNTEEIKAVFIRREIRRGKRLIFYRAPRETEATVAETDSVARMAFVVSRRCGTAVRRNRIKRILREIIRHNWDRLTPGYDYIIRVDPDSLTPDKIKQEDFLDDCEILFRWS